MVTQIYSAASPFQPKGDHNRRIALGLEREQLAELAGVGPDELRQYETTAPDHEYDAAVAASVALTLDRIEAGEAIHIADRDAAAAMDGGVKPGPAEAPVQVRDAGAEAQANEPEDWDDIDEAVDETFPASDPITRY